MKAPANGSLTVDSPAHPEPRTDPLPDPRRRASPPTLGTGTVSSLPRVRGRPSRPPDPSRVHPEHSTPSVSVVMPARNEADNLRHILPRIPSWVDELIVVDGNSDDDTPAVARAGWPDVRIVHQERTGKGDALWQGFAAAEGDIIVMLDADGSTDPAEIPRFVAALRTGADVAKGTRFVIGGGSADLTPVRAFGNWALTRMVNVIWRARLTDLCYGYFAFWRDRLEELDPKCTGFEFETLLTVRAIRSGLSLVEVPSYESARIAGTSQLRTLRDGMRVLRTICAEWIRPR
ncbi:MAG TPA: glycosyltransferase [Acidimicrobiales bacterium]|nr:glycosyltransferase [Acidimicrobiales bacterium]